ncbi:multiple coagulation factor deficiency protein 2 homolog isoform X2 [Paramacrobiotus metropolitanus]|uniref:multiple coagulation factor deficiency protein 2 homolog isoform X2 n=1 Tax=Paramacrobiotus metropolitanus TaxID=2943436 RepID=UPI002445C108|nr:multiple coagulation factor deficiency protein 2 homolog isoform X2 [Paramacrobiotus metropolitanus]
MILNLINLLFICACALVLRDVTCHASNQNYNLPPIPQPHLQPGQNPMHDKAFVQDKAHIQEHLEGITNKRPEDMNELELQFHYFKLHDTDSNNKLDGLELIHAITHYHGGEVPDVKGPRMLTDHELSMTVDAILLDDDKNNDGYIDYSEFATSQTRNQGPNNPNRQQS